ncbi:hypothetical protein EXIGLDRAFT_704649 [Exidia glandulosa HHB12029]|uniref:F-box domain-containing protein n=1 Tax=Exidia glandulosa HHB12029 TaxID=1314781 RepID=A0A165KU63_EXIGL|nr:hypothetical protein EXIGLDRAFT_704649 [Exidia glandulosa HHB12029]
MYVGAREQYAKRIRLEADVLAAARARAAELRLAESETRATLAATQAKLDAIVTELDEIASREPGLSNSLDSARCMYRRMLWTNVIPLDVLHCIFEAAATYIDPDKPLVDAITVASSNPAFGLATVCSRWRQLALSIRTSWTFVRVERRSGRPYDEDIDDHTERIRVILSRSNSAPLDVVIHLDEYPEEALSLLHEMFTTLEPEAWRWRRSELFLPPWLPLEPCLDFLKGSMPSLTHLSVIIEGDDVEPVLARPQYFSQMPLLQHLELQDTGISCVQTHFVFNDLRSLALWQHVGVDQFLDMVRAASLTLESLRICARIRLDTAVDSIALPALHTLELDGRVPGFQGVIHAPKVQHLELSKLAISITHASIFDALSATVTTLVLRGGSFGAQSVDILQALASITSVTFVRLPSETSILSAGRFFHALAESSPPTWPTLRSLRFAIDSLDGDTGNGLATLVRARNCEIAVPSSGTASRSPSRIESVDLPNTAPLWLRDTIKSLL